MMTWYASRHRDGPQVSLYCSLIRNLRRNTMLSNLGKGSLMMSLSRRKRQRSIKKSSPRVTLASKKKPQGDPRKVTRTVQVASHDFGKSPARVRKAMIEALDRQ